MSGSLLPIDDGKSVKVVRHPDQFTEVGIALPASELEALIELGEQDGLVVGFVATENLLDPL